MYKYYDELIHFVVGGKKILNLKKPDRVKFEKDICGIYIAHQTIDELYKYSIRIIDLMDLIEFIDQLEGDAFSNIHDYIKKSYW